MNIPVRIPVAARSLAILVAGLAAAAIVAHVLLAACPNHDWLSYGLLVLWLWLAMFTVASLSFGALVVHRFLRIKDLPRAEMLLTSMAVGVFCFAVLMYALGALHLFNSTVAVLLPSAMILAGAGRLRSLVLGSGRPALSGRGLLTFAVWGFGAFWLVFLYLGAMTPDAINHDARWVHIPIAQDYAREGWLVPFLEWHKDTTHLASILYTWAYLVPGIEQPWKWMLVMHLEFLLFLGTLLGVVATVQFLLKRSGLSHAWAVMFLYPAIFIYDSNLGGSADHVLAFFTLPLLIAAIRCWEQALPPNYCILTGLLAGAAVLTKYQAMYVVVPAGLLPAMGFAAQLVRRLRGDGWPARRLLLAPALLGGSLLLALSPTMLKNGIYHHNPFYPMMQPWFTGSTPWVKDGAFYVSHIWYDPHWVPTEPFLTRIWDSLGILFTFSFKPFYSFVGDTPKVGFLFTCLAPIGLLLVVPRRRLAAAIFVGAGAVFFWAMMYRVERNLQTFVPVLAAVTAAVVAAAWQLGWPARLGVGALVVLQVVWGTPLMLRDGWGRAADAVELMRAALDGHAEQHLNKYFQGERAANEALPKDAVVLRRAMMPHLGIDRPCLTDWQGMQSIIQYSEYRSAYEVYQRFRKFGITHIMMMDDWVRSWQGEVFVALLTHGQDLPRQTFGGHYGPFTVWDLRRAAPRPEPPLQVLLFGMPGYGTGLFGIEQLSVLEELDPEFKKYPKPLIAVSDGNQAAKLMDRAGAVIVEKHTSMSGEAARRLETCFSPVPAPRSNATVYVPKRNQAGCGAAPDSVVPAEAARPDP